VAGVGKQVWPEEWRRGVAVGQGLAVRGVVRHVVQVDVLVQRAQPRALHLCPQPAPAGGFGGAVVPLELLVQPARRRPAAREAGNDDRPAAADVGFLELVARQAVGRAALEVAAVAEVERAQVAHRARLRPPAQGAGGRGQHVTAGVCVRACV
jgi:hypothetical protein